MKKALFVATIASFIDGFENNDTKILQQMGYQVTAACSSTIGIKSETINSLNQKNIDLHHIDFERSPFSKNTFIAYKQLKKLINNEQYDLIHCHTPVGGILTRLAARKARKKGTKVIYTAHGFHFFKGAPLINWLFYYPAEKICSYFTDVLITINQEDFKLANDKLKAKKVVYIPGVGVETSKFQSVLVNKNDKRQELGLSSKNIILLSVGELNINKNHQIIIKALAKINDTNVHYIIAGVGDSRMKLLSLSNELGVQNNVHLLGYRSDIAELCHSADVFCFPSLREGLSVALMESMSTGLPCVVSKIRGNIDLIDHGEGGSQNDPNSVDEFVQSISALIFDRDLRFSMGQHNLEKIGQFDTKNVEKTMKKIYSNINIK